MDRNCNLVGDTGEDSRKAGRISRLKQRKPYSIEYRARLEVFLVAFPRWSDWRVRRRYASERQRDQALEALDRTKDQFFEYRAGGDKG